VGKKNWNQKKALGECTIFKEGYDSSRGRRILGLVALLLLPLHCTAERDPNPGVLIQRAARRPQHPASGGSFLYYEGEERAIVKRGEKWPLNTHTHTHRERVRSSPAVSLFYISLLPFFSVFFFFARLFCLLRLAVHSSLPLSLHHRLDRLLKRTVVTRFHRRRAFLAISPLNGEGFTHKRRIDTHTHRTQTDRWIDTRE